jgi:hypothetical protein
VNPHEYSLATGDASGGAAGDVTVATDVSGAGAGAPVDLQGGSSTGAVGGRVIETSGVGSAGGSVELATGAVLLSASFADGTSTVDQQGCFNIFENALSSHHFSVMSRNVDTNTTGQ